MMVLYMGTSTRYTNKVLQRQRLQRNLSWLHPSYHKEHNLVDNDVKTKYCRIIVYCNFDKGLKDISTENLGLKAQ